MCLYVITNNYKRTRKVEGEGWKYFAVYKDVGVPQFMYYPLRRGQERWDVPVGKWIKAANGTIFTSGTNHYRKGFHIYSDASLLPVGATRLPQHIPMLFRVKYRGVVATGLESGCPVVVAREMYVVPNNKPSLSKGHKPKQDKEQ